MRKAYRELFDGVHASERLQMEVMNMKNTESTDMRPKRRFPAAALIAAALVIALAGTAVAEGVFGRVSVSPGTISGSNGHTFQGNFQTVSLETLSEELLAYSQEQEGTLAFDSWSEAEEFIGTEVANNSRLEQMAPTESGIRPENMPEIRGNCLVTVSSSLRLPEAVRIKADYHDSNADVHICAVLKISDKTRDTSFSIGNGISGNTWTEEAYVTPNGMEVTILTTETPMTDLDGSPITYTQYEASFTTNNAFFYLRSVVGKGKSADQVLATLKEVLDAYE